MRPLHTVRTCHDSLHLFYPGKWQIRVLKIGGICLRLCNLLHLLLPKSSQLWLCSGLLLLLSRIVIGKLLRVLLPRSESLMQRVDIRYGPSRTL